MITAPGSDSDGNCAVWMTPFLEFVVPHIQKVGNASTLTEPSSSNGAVQLLDTLMAHRKFDKQTKQKMRLTVTATLKAD